MSKTKEQIEADIDYLESKMVKYEKPLENKFFDAKRIKRLDLYQNDIDKLKKKL